MECSSFQLPTTSCHHRIFASDRTIRSSSSLSSIERCNCGQWSSTVCEGVCVFLATQGAHSRIRWSSSQDCQHVISSDIRPYNKKLLDISPVFHQEVVLPDSFMLRTISPTAPGFEAAVRLLQGGRRPSTVKSYDQKWLKFEAFTSQALSEFLY